MTLLHHAGHSTDSLYSLAGISGRIKFVLLLSFQSEVSLDSCRNPSHTDSSHYRKGKPNNQREDNPYYESIGYVSNEQATPVDSSGKEILVI